MVARAKSGAAVARAVEALGDPRSMPDLAWLCQLLGRNPNEVEAVLSEVGEYGPFEAEIHARHLGRGRDFYAQFRAPFELYTMVRLLRPAHTVETGVSSGVSSAHFLLGLARNRTGQLHSVDLPLQQKGAELAEKESPVALPPGCSSGWAVPDYLKGRWDLRIGPCEELLPGLCEELPSVDLFLHDSRHTPAHLTFELETVAPKLVPGAIVLADNTQWTGRAFDRFAEELGVPVLRRSGTDLVGLRFPGGAAKSRPHAAKSPPKAPRRAPRRRAKRSTRATRSR